MEIDRPTEIKLHGQLLRVEWEEEKKRLANMFIKTLIGYAYFLCLAFYWRFHNGI